MRLSSKIWKEFGLLAGVVDIVDHDNGTVKFRADTSQQDIDAVHGIVAAHDPLAVDSEQIKADINAQRDAALVAGCLFDGALYPFDDVMISAILGRVVRWQAGRIPVDATLPVRLKNNTTVMLDRAQHLDLADALSNHGDTIYAASWVAKDAL